MNSNHLHSLLFAAAVLFSVLLGGVRQEAAQETVLEQKTETTSLAATPKAATLSNTLAIVSPNVSATAVLVKDLAVAEPLFSLNLQQQWPIASLTKLMTAVIVREKISADAKIKMSEKAIATEGDAGNFMVGQSYTLDVLIHALLKVSSNDAAAALAEFYGEERFVEAMNEKAKMLGMRSTRFFDPTGLSPLNQSTLVDLERLIEYIFYNHQEIFEITREKEGNIHPFAGEPDFLGGKTGFIDEASGNLISLFNHEGRQFLIIVLGSEDRAKDTRELYNRFVNQ